MLYYGLELQSCDTYMQFKESDTPGTPPANEIRQYGSDSGGISTMCWKNDNGAAVCLPTAAGTLVTGSGVAGRVAFWNGTSSLSSDADLTFATDTLTATKIIAPTSITISALTAGSVLFSGASGLISQDNANLFWDDANNRLGLGTATPADQFHGVAPDASSFNFTLETYGTGPTPNYRGRAARGTKAAPSALQANDLIWTASGLPYGATGFASGARASIRFLAGENQTDANQGAYISFLTTPLLSTTIAERFRVGPSGQWGIGGATFGTANNIFKSGGASAAPSWGTVNILDSDSHGDTLTGTVVRGDLIVGNSTPKWSRKAVGTANQYLGTDGTDVLWRAQSTLDHGSIGGLADDDHTQYALLAGRSGGQTLIGGTAAADDLTLRATTGVGAGSEFIIFQTGSNGAVEVARMNNAGQLGIGQTAPTSPLHLTRTTSTAGLPAVIHCDGSFTNADDNNCFIDNELTIASTASVAVARGILNRPTFNPTTGATITEVYASQYQAKTGSGGGAITQLYAMVAQAVYGTIKPANATGLVITNMGSAGITQAVGMRIDAQSGATNNHTMDLPATGDTPVTTWTAGVPSTNPAGYVKILVSGNTRYIPFWT